ncbi:MAG: hypothetical protein LIP01_07185 [Tannerellaceae bacterium]|nr:hypothetical protein [Tannerellaceae bacterium]
MRPYPVFRNFKDYFWKRLLPAILIAGSGLLFLNFFLAYRLQSVLRQELKERVATASGGFYSLTFENLSIHLLNGELSIEGIRILPDSTVFSQW